MIIGTINVLSFLADRVLILHFPSLRQVLTSVLPKKKSPLLARRKGLAAVGAALHTCAEPVCRVMYRCCRRMKPLACQSDSDSSVNKPQYEDEQEGRVPALHDQQFPARQLDRPSRSPL